MVTAAYMKDTLRPQLFRSRRKADGFSGLRLDGWEGEPMNSNLRSLQ